jgi:hypothetical protein
MPVGGHWETLSRGTAVLCDSAVLSADCLVSILQRPAAKTECANRRHCTVLVRVIVSITTLPGGCEVGHCQLPRFSSCRIGSRDELRKNPVESTIPDYHPVGESTSDEVLLDS